MVFASGGGSSSLNKRDLGGLWIDYALLPERLDEHLQGLSSGALSSPSHSELLNMFLEQAVSNYKLARKELDAQDVPARQSLGKTAAVLCERAVKVAIAAQFTLEDIEGLVARQIQSLLLKALIKYDKARSLLHECDLHRWVIRRGLSPGPVSAPSVVEASGFFQDGLGAVEGIESQETAVSFLENVLEKGNLVTREQAKQNSEGKKKIVNGQVDGTSDGYVSQLMFDLAEAHFMKGRMKRAHELFTQCCYLVTGVPGPSPVPRDRLNGFIAACRAFGNSDAGLDEAGAVRTPGQETIFCCEKQRLKRKYHRISNEYCNGVTKTASVKENGVHGMSQDVKPINGCEFKITKATLVHEDKDLVEVVSGDLLKRHLSWGYCLSLARDTSLSTSVRCKLAACNALRSLLDGGTFESVLQMIDGHEEKDAVDFLLHQMQKSISGGALDDEKVSLLRDFGVHICCIVEETWCWDLATKQGLVSREDVSKFRKSFQKDETKPVIGIQDPGPGTTLLDVLQAQSPAAIDGILSGKPPSSDTGKLLLMRAFDALENSKSTKLAKEFLLLAKRTFPEDVDTDLFLWFSDRTKHSLPELPEPESSGCPTPSLGVVEYIVVKMIDAEDWPSLKTFFRWGQVRHKSDNESLGGVFREAGLLSDLLPQCLKFQEISAGGTTYDELSRLKAGVWQGFEDLMTFLRDNFRQKTTLPIISKISSISLLEKLASCTAGWIHRCHETLELSRYGCLAEVTSTSSRRPSFSNKSSSSSSSTSSSADCGKYVFRLLMERLLKLAKNTQRIDKGKDSKWLVSLADLAFAEEAYLKALQLYLQAGAVRSSFYCDRMASMARDFFTPWVITRMVTACKEIGARLQAVVLCQCLPNPDYETAFRILHEDPLIVDRDAASYFECVWEIPILELLVHMHAKAGDRARVNTLISLLQQPALNVHNPASIRRAHIVAMEQRFLQRFYAELV